MSERSSTLDEVLAELVERSSEKENAGREPVSRQIQGLLHSGDEDPFLDSALAMLGFTSLTVQQTLSTILGKTLLTVLSSSLASAIKLYFERLENATLSTSASFDSCFLGTPGSHEAKSPDDAQLFCGTPFYISRTGKVIEDVLCFLKRSEIEDQLILDILEALVKMYAMTSMCKSKLVGSCLLYEMEDKQEEVLVSAAFQHLINFSLEKTEKIYNRLNPSIRLLLWRLQPGLLVQDLSTVLETISERPLISIQNEFRCRQSWCNLIIAMASGPDVFKEGRRILNDWLLLSGAAFVWEMNVELGFLIRDVLEHPSLWKVSVEEGIRLPSLSSFYGGALRGLVVMLCQSPSWAGLREISILIENEVAKNRGCGASFLQVDGIMRNSHGTNSSYQCMAFSSTLWMLLMDFPTWTLFACFSLFQKLIASCESYGDQRAFGSELSLDGPESNDPGHAGWLNHQETAAKYIAWQFSPHDEKLRDMVVQMLKQIAQSWLQINDESPHTIPAAKRRKRMTVCTETNPSACDRQSLVEGMLSPESLPSDLQRERTIDDSTSSQDAVAAVHNWLLNFQECCFLLDDYSPGETCQVAEIETKKHAKRKLALGAVSSEGATPYGSHSSEAMRPHQKSFTFFCGLPLVALFCSPFLHIDVVVHLFLHFVMVGSGYLLSRGNIYEEEIKGLACREPSHRTEGFTEACQEPFCLTFSQDVSMIKAYGVSRVFKFLETLELLEVSSFTEASHKSCLHDSFKEAVARQLQSCLKSWSQHSDSVPSLIMLDDLQQRASLWAGRAGLESKTFKAFQQALQSLDILIATSVVDDTV